MTMRTYEPKSKAQEEAVRREAMDLVSSDREQYGKRVLRRLESATRFQSIGRRQYVYVGDIAEALERELNSDMEGAE